MSHLVYLVLSLWLFAFPTFAQQTSQYRSDQAQAWLAAEPQFIEPGKPFKILLRIDLEQGWHVYTDPPGDAGIPVSIVWTLPPGFKAGDIEWPPAETFKEGDLTTYGYSGNVALPVTITPPAQGGAREVTLKATASWLGCKNICIPETAALTLQLPVIASISPPATQQDYNLLFAVALAFLGGVVLNLMPCVFPVLSLKCLAVVKQGEISRKAAQREGIGYTLGILLSFAIIAGIMIALKQAGHVLGWGFQMQSPVFVSAMTLLLFVIGLSLNGVFTLPAFFGRPGLAASNHSGFTDSFYTGVLAALVATPCTVPFMAAAIGYALVQPAAITFLILQTLGLGLALPFLLISFLPRLRALLPKPGIWMLRLKEILAFPMYLSSVWLLWVLSRQSGADAAMWVLAAAVLLALLLWISRHKAGWFAALLAIGLVAATLQGVSHMDEQVSITPSIASEDNAFSIERIEALRASGNGVFVNATAAWCITCKVNEHTTLDTEQVKRLFTERGIVYVVADWTRSDPVITEYLQSFGRRGVPLYVYYPPIGEPVMLPQLLTPQIIESAISARK